MYLKFKNIYSALLIVTQALLLSAREPSREETPLEAGFVQVGWWAPRGAE